MYLHIGENEIINSKEIIGIFDIQTLKQSRNNLRVLNMLKSEKRDIKSVVFVNKNEKDDEKFSIISTRTLNERLEKVEDFTY